MEFPMPHQKCVVLLSRDCDITAFSRYNYSGLLGNRKRLNAPIVLVNTHKGVQQFKDFTFKFFRSC